MESLIGKADQIEDILIEGRGRPKRALRETWFLLGLNGSDDLCSQFHLVRQGVRCSNFKQCNFPWRHGLMVLHENGGKTIPDSSILKFLDNFLCRGWVIWEVQWLKDLPLDIYRICILYHCETCISTTFHCQEITFTFPQLVYL